MKKFSAVKKFLSGIGVAGMISAGVGGSVSATDEGAKKVYTIFQAEGECTGANAGNDGKFGSFSCKVNNTTNTLAWGDLKIVKPQSCPTPESWTNMRYTSLVGFITGFIAFGAAIGAAAMNFFGSNK